MYNIDSLGARDFSPSYGLAPRAFVGLKSHAPIDFVARQLPIDRARKPDWVGVAQNFALPMAVIP